MLQTLCMCVHIYTLDMIFLKFDLVYFYEFAGYLYVCVKEPCECSPKRTLEKCLSILYVTEIFFTKDKFFHYCYIICQMQIFL